MEKWLVAVRVLLPLLFALVYHRRGFDGFENLAGFLLIFATFGLVVEVISIPLFKLFKLPIKLHLAVFYAFLIVFTLGAVLLYNKTRPVVAKLVVINGAKKVNLCADGRCLTLKPHQNGVFNFRKPAVLRVEDRTYRVERGVYILNLDGGARIVLYKLAEFKRLSKTRMVVKVEEKTLGVFEGFVKIWENPKVEVYINEKPPRDRLVKFGEALVVFAKDAL